eukprot:3738002-Rhodomonas_salina.1
MSQLKFSADCLASKRLDLRIAVAEHGTNRGGSGEGEERAHLDLACELLSLCRVQEEVALVLPVVLCNVRRSLVVCHSKCWYTNDALIDLLLSHPRRCTRHRLVRLCEAKAVVDQRVPVHTAARQQNVLGSCIALQLTGLRREIQSR